MLIFLIVFFSCLYAQQDIGVVKKEIYTLQYERQNISELHELLDHKNASIRLLVVQALGRIQNKDSISFLAKLLKDADVEIRIHVAFALGQMWHIDAESFLLKAMVTEKKIPVLEKIIEALGKVGETQTVAIFKKWMPEKKLCEFITKASGILVYRGVHNDQLIHQLIYFSQNESVSIRGHVSYALMRSKDSRVVNHLIQLLYDKNAFVRMNATRGLGYLKENKAVAHLYLRLYDEDARVATNAISALSNFKEVDVKKIIPLLTNKITNKNSHIFLATVKLLGTLKATESKQELIKAMKKSSFLEQGEICIALAKIDPKTCLEEIEKLEKTNTNALLTSKIAEALGNIDTKTSFEKLSKMLNNKNILVIQMVVSSLGKLTKEDTTPLLIESLKTLDMAVITYAAQSLATKKAIKSIPALVEIYSKLHLPQDIEAMQAIINAVGEMAQKSNETAINFLQKVNSNDEALLSAIASKYLKKLDIKSNKITQKKNQKHCYFLMKKCKL